ncbi:MAG TPA: PrpF domain-containing protein [Candidatus Binatia bacterium]|nr:PrpF domain-containing protein [Candidatus Binatia bacterium]
MGSRALRVTLMRGGTSKGVFLRSGDLPEAGPERDALLLELMGTPDPMQIDGLGGTHSSTSKVMAVGPASEPDVDVDYLFAQVGIDTAVVDYAGNCGNLTAAVGHYAVDEGLVDVCEPVTAVRLRNLNTGVRVLAHVPVAEGRALSAGSQWIAGVPTPGAPIWNEYLDPAGSVFGTLFPTGVPRESLVVGSGRVDVSIVDVTHPVAFVWAAEAGLAGDERPAELNGRPELLARLEALRGACAVRLGRVGRAEDAAGASATVPRLVLVGRDGGDDDSDLRVLGLSVGRVHHALPITSTLCTAAAAGLPGTLPHEAARLDGSCERIRIGHPRGVVEGSVSLEPGVPPWVRSVGIVRTARRLLDGTAYLRGE